MKRFVVGILAAVLSASALVPQEKTKNPDEILILQLERAWNQAEAKQEINEVSSLLADRLRLWMDSHPTSSSSLPSSA